MNSLTQLPRLIFHKSLDLARAMRGRISGMTARKIYFVTADQDWVIRSLWEETMRNITAAHPTILCARVSSSRHLYGQIIHFGSVWKFVGEIARTHPSNRLVVTFYHGHPEMGEAMRHAIKTVIENLSRLDGVVTACALMADRLRSWGVPEEKLFIIPIGTNTKIFRPPTAAQKQAKRRELDIPEDAICIGSFQKDGDGWDEGLEPKLIKGPDVFVACLARLRETHPVFALLTGPARGYVKKNLTAAGVPYKHVVLDDVALIPSFYHCLDLYLICSREEGGPKALTEGMASGVPLVSTRVGMATDLITDGENGYLAASEDVEAIVLAARKIIDQPELRQRFIKKGLATVQAYDMQPLAEKCYREIYQAWL